MRMIESVARMKQFHSFVDREVTGTPTQFARKLGISRSCLYKLIEELKSYNFPITYSRSKQSFYYYQSVDLKQLSAFEVIEDEQRLKNINGGMHISPSVHFDGRNEFIFALYSNTKAKLQALMCSGF